MLEVYVMSAFSKNNSGGNKAGVVIQDYKLDDQEKLNVASRLGYSETVFLSGAEQADIKLEYFTPKGEVSLCGHATIAAFSLLNSLSRLTKSNYTIETKSGMLNIAISKGGLVFMEQNNPTYYDQLEHSIFKNCFNIDYIAKNLPIQIVSTGLRDILIPVDNTEHLKDLTPNFKAISDVSKKMNVVGIHAFTLVDDENVTAICRNFAPLFGINEESATGTSNCALACYLFKHDRKQKRYVFEQGHNLHALSRILVEVESKDDALLHVAVGGYGYLIGKRLCAIHG